MDTVERKLTNEEIDKSVEEAKKRIAKNKLKSVKLLQSYAPDYKIGEYKNKKERNRKRSKIQKLSRKKNR